MTRSDGLALGAILAVLAHGGAFSRHQWRFALAIVLLGVLAVGALFCLQSFVIAIGARWPGISASSLAIAAMLTCSSLAVACPTGLIRCNQGRPALRLLRRRPLCTLGVISFGIYLYHPVYFSVLRTSVLDDRQTMAQTALVYAATLLTSYVSWRVLEEPFLEFKPRFAYPGIGSSPEVPAPSDATGDAP